MNMWAVSDMQTGIQRTRDHQSEGGKGSKRGNAVLWQIRLSPALPGNDSTRRLTDIRLGHVHDLDSGM